MDDLSPSRRARPPGARVRLIDRYEAIAETSRSMVAAARAQHWTEVARLESLCRRQVHKLKQAAQLESLRETEQAARVQLLRAILADDAEIRRLAEPWLAELDHLRWPQPPTGDG